MLGKKNIHRCTNTHFLFLTINIQDNSHTNALLTGDSSPRLGSRISIEFQWKQHKWKWPTSMKSNPYNKPTHLHLTTLFQKYLTDDLPLYPNLSIFCTSSFKILLISRNRFLASTQWDSCLISELKSYAVNFLMLRHRVLWFQSICSRNDDVGGLVVRGLFHLHQQQSNKTFKSVWLVS